MDIITGRAPPPAQSRVNSAPRAVWCNGPEDKKKVMGVGWRERDKREEKKKKKKKKKKNRTQPGWCIRCAIPSVRYWKLEQGASRLSIILKTANHGESGTTSVSTSPNHEKQHTTQHSKNMRDMARHRSA